MSIGYACLTVGVPNCDLKSCILKNATETRLLDLISHNLNSLEKMIQYNIENDIKLFRISSDIIPFGSNPVNNISWWQLFNHEFKNIGEKIKNSRMRVSMHPGQYTVLNSPNEDVVKRAIEDLNYHTKVLDSLGVSSKHKIVLHIGGIYNDKEQAIKRFITNYQRLGKEVKNRLVIENDDKLYNVSDVLEISAILNIPVIYDNLHNKLNPSDIDKGDIYWINECRRTWKERDGNQKVHYSQQDLLKKPGSHSQTIAINEFLNYYTSLDREDLDIMLEVKDKNLSAVKCINCTSIDKNIQVLEREWAKYKYSILEKSPLNYFEIRKLLIHKNIYPAISFYSFIEIALKQETTIDNAVNAAQHVWGYFKKNALDKEKTIFLNSIENMRLGLIPAKQVKKILWKMSVKYIDPYLLNSYYFIID